MVLGNFPTYSNSKAAWPIGQHGASGILSLLSVCPGLYTRCLSLLELHVVIVLLNIFRVTWWMCCLRGCGVLARNVSESVVPVEGGQQVWSRSPLEQSTFSSLGSVALWPAHAGLPTLPVFPGSSPSPPH